MKNLLHALYYLIILVFATGCSKADNDSLQEEIKPLNLLEYTLVGTHSESLLGGKKIVHPFYIAFLKENKVMASIGSGTYFYKDSRLEIFINDKTLVIQVDEKKRTVQIIENKLPMGINFIKLQEITSENRFINKVFSGSMYSVIENNYTLLNVAFSATRFVTYGQIINGNPPHPNRYIEVFASGTAFYVVDDSGIHEGVMIDGKLQYATSPNLINFRYGTLSVKE